MNVRGMYRPDMLPAVGRAGGRSDACQGRAVYAYFNNDNAGYALRTRRR